MKSWQQAFFAAAMTTHRGIRIPEPDIGDSIFEKVYILENEAEIRHQGVHIIIFDIAASESDRPAADIPEPCRKRA